MNNNKQSITVKVIIGYFLIAALAAIAVWFVYSQVVGYTQRTQSNIATNKKLYLVGDVATNLYQAESLSRQLIRTGDSSDLAQYKVEIDSIRITLKELEETYADTILKKEIFSINLLLSQKTSNLEELLELRAKNENQSYYAKVITELQKVDESFEDPNYDTRFANLEPHQRRVLVQLLEYSKMENARQVTNQSIDSLVNSVKNILMNFEQADRRYRETLRQKENELMANEININSQLRNILSTIEEEERETSLAQVAESQEVVKKTSRTIAILGAISFLIILASLFLVVRDVSKSQQYRRKLEKAKQLAESLLKSREQFMATVTHDLRSPLTTVMGYANLLEKSDLNSTQQQYLRQVKKSSDYILRLVNDLLDLSKLEAGKMLIEELSFNVKNLIEDSVENCIPPKKMEELSVEVKVSEELEEPIVTDPFRIKQILTNLVTNACKFTEEGFILVEAYLEKEDQEQQLVIVVKDSGIGISEEKKEEIFEEFSQEDKSIEKRFGGSGLGLAISKKLVHLLNGSIHLESEQNKGSEFTVKIPIKLARTFDAPPIEEESGPTANVGGLSALIVDDEQAQISLLQELLKANGMKVESTTDGEEALKLLKKEHFHILLTDIQMPGMGGFELLQEIKKDPEIRNLPVIALSGRTDVPTAEYKKRGFSGNLLKPYSPKELIQKIEKTLQVNFRAKETQNLGNKANNKSFSLEEVNQFAAGDKEALKIILSSFIESTRTNLSLLEKAQEKGDRKELAAISHKMLPMFRQVKATSIAAKLERMENPRLSISEDELRELKTETNVLINEIQEIID